MFNAKGDFLLEFPQDAKGKLLSSIQSTDSRIQLRVNPPVDPTQKNASGARAFKFSLHNITWIVSSA